MRTYLLSSRKPKTTKMAHVGEWGVQAPIAPGKYFVLNRVRSKITGSCMWMVLNIIYLVTAYCHFRLHRSPVYSPEMPGFGLSQCHRSFCSLLPRMPFSFLVSGKVRVTLQRPHYKSPGRLSLHPSCSYTHLASPSTWLSRHCVIMYAYSISLMPARCCGIGGHILSKIACRAQRWYQMFN